MSGHAVPVVCAQYRYTWAERRLDGRGAGFGVVLRSRDWPGELGDDHRQPELADLLTNLSASARRDTAELVLPQVAHRRVAGGSLLVAKRAVGTDGAGRPGNYCVHALFDPTGTLGTLDLVALLRAGVFRLEREVDTEPSGEAEPVRVTARSDWADVIDHRADRGHEQVRPDGYGDQPLRYDSTDGLVPMLAALTTRLPADLVNQLELDGSSDRPASAGPPGRPGEIDALLERFAAAVDLGAAEHETWWRRFGRSGSDWVHESERFVMMNQPVRKVADDWLWARWDDATDRGRALVAAELVHRNGLADRPEAVDEVRKRPGLLDRLIETGVHGSTKARAGAARWVAAAGDDADAVDFAAELVSLDDDPLPAPLRNRLQRHSPDALPDQVARAIAEQLDGAGEMATDWQRRCLDLFLAGEPSCTHVDHLVRGTADDELAAALRGRSVIASPDVAWRALTGVLPASRVAGLFARADAETGESLLRTPFPPLGRDEAEPFVRFWPSLARTLDWAEWPVLLVVRLVAAEDTLRRQRRALLIVVLVLLVAVVVLAVLLAVTGGSAPPTRG